MWPRLIGVAIIALALYGLYWSIDNGAYDRGYTARKNEERDKQLDEVTEALARANHAEVQHEKDQLTINRLSSESSRVRVKFPVCKSTSGENPDGGSGILSDRMEQGFAELKGKIGELMLRCDQLNIDAIKANSTKG